MKLKQYAVVTLVANANKVNLKFEEAKPVLEAQLAKSIAGIM